MAKDKDAPKEVDFNDKSLEEALRTGNNSKLPDNIVIKSPYGRGIDKGAGGDAGDARGDDGNLGSGTTGPTT
jgi:hypothetical protein